MEKKVLYSPDYGAGWASWATGHGKELAEDSILIELVEAGRHLNGKKREYGDSGRGISDEFRERCREICGGEEPYYGGAYDLKVTTVYGPYRIDEYDGSESIVGADEEEWW